MGGPPEIEPSEVLAVPEGCIIPGSHRFVIRSNHGPREPGGCEKMAKTEGQTPVNRLTPNVKYSGRTAPLTSKVAFLYLFDKHRY